MTLKINYKKLFASVLAIALVSCSNPWEDRENNSDPSLDSTLNEAILNTVQTKKFGELLKQTGYDKVLSESKTYTVFAPTNEAIDQVDPAILNNPEKLLLFVQNHIALISYPSLKDQETITIKMLSNKYLKFTGSTTVDDASIVAADKYAANGVFHIVNKALAPKQNIWQYVNDHSEESAMAKYLLSLKELNIYDSDIAAKANTTPGALSDSLSNSFLKNVYNLNNEKNSYTLFLIEDDDYVSEVQKLIPYLTKTSDDITATYASYFTVRDMAFPKAYKLNDLPSQLTSRFGVNVPIDKTQIIGEPIVLSNGIIYRIKKVDVPLINRLVTKKIEGESTSGYSSKSTSNLNSKIFHRERKDPSGIIFKDIMAQNTGVADFVLNYKASDLYSTTYKVYWRAINDIQTAVFKQRIGIFSQTSPIQMTPYIDVPVGLYDEVYVGELILTKADDVNYIQLIANTVTTNGLNTVALDYIKLVPVIK